MYSIRQDLLLFSKITIDESNLFKNSAVFDAKPYVKIPNYRAAVVPHLFIKKLLLEESDAIGLKERRDYWNLQLIIFRNPIDMQDLKQYKSMQLELCIKFPDNSV